MREDDKGSREHFMYMRLFPHGTFFERKPWAVIFPISLPPSLPEFFFEEGFCSVAQASLEL